MVSGNPKAWDKLMMYCSVNDKPDKNSSSSSNPSKPWIFLLYQSQIHQRRFACFNHHDNFSIECSKCQYSKIFRFTNLTLYWETIFCFLTSLLLGTFDWKTYPLETLTHSTKRFTKLKCENTNTTSLYFWDAT